MSNFVSYANATDLMTAIGNKIKALNGAYIFKGSSAFASLPASLTDDMTGYVYNVTDNFTTDARFVEGAGKKYKAGTNIAVANVGTAQVPDMKFDVIGSFYDLDTLTQAIADVSAMITAPFDETQAYAIGDFCTYQNDLYVFTSAHTANDPWDATEVTATTVMAVIDAFEQATNAKISNVTNSIAPQFDATETYAIDDIVMYGNTLYKFTAAHTGAWDVVDVTTATVSDLITAAEPNSLTTSEVNTLIGLLD